MADLAPERIRAFVDMKDGWCYGDGVGFAEATITLALDLHRALVDAGFTETDAFPSLSGEISVTAYDGADYWDFEARTNGLVDFLHERDGECVEEQEGLTPEQATSRMQHRPSYDQPMNTLRS
jgi:hypothetical protein